MTRTEGHTAGRGRLTALVAIILATGLLLAALPTLAQAAPPSQFWQKCPSGSGAGQCDVPFGIATDPGTGHLFVADTENDRINEFDAWGSFVKTWGWDVVASGPDDDTSAPEDQFEVCVPANGDVCKAGVRGVGAGQFTFPQGIALDAAGNVYVAEGEPLFFSGRRVQKFDPEGNFLLMFGGKVNKTKEEAAAPEAQQNLCPVDPGDVCQAASEGAGNGQFDGNNQFGFYIAITPDDKIYVGDKDRIQRFNTGGVYQGQIPLLEAGTVGPFAFDPSSGDLYFAYASELAPFPSGKAKQPNVYRLDPSTGTVLDTLEVGIPTAVATDPQGRVYVFDDAYPASNPSEPGNHIRRILEFDSSGNQVGVFDQNQSFGAFGEDKFTARSRGIATNSACGAAGINLYVSNSDVSNSFVRAYGPPPDPSICPPPSVPPTIADSYAISADTNSASVRAAINPHFWPDARYYVQYGLADCSLGGCQEQPLSPGSLLTKAVTDAEITTSAVFLDGLSPDTTYHYRFVASSSGGGPAFGPDRTFHTFAPRPAPNTSCPNQAFRIGPGAALLDCRAYEMVSPVDKNNGDVGTSEPGAGGLPAESGLAQPSPDGKRMTFASPTAFAGAESAPLASQYLATRDPEAGWSTRSINPPIQSIPLYAPGGHDLPLFKAFSDDLCSGWVLQGFDRALVPGAPPGVPNLYRRSNCGKEGYELLTTTPPPGFGTELGSTYVPMIRGFSKDGTRSVFTADAALTPNAIEKKGLYQVYVAYDGGKLRLVSVLPNGLASPTQSGVGVTQAEYSAHLSASIYHAVSDDGSRVFWTDTGTEGAGGGQFGTGPGKLYLRLNATEPSSLVSAGKCTQPARACTIAVSADTTSRFWAADPEGSKAIYTTGSFGGVVEGPGQATLHLFDLAKGESEAIATGVKGVMGSSEDLSRVYFASTDILTGAAQNSEGDVAQAGKPNLYLYQQGAGLTFVATLSSLDTVNGESLSAPISPIATLSYKRSSRVSPDGLHAAFTSAAPLTGYDNTDSSSGQPDAEVFHYDAAAQKLLCVSCNPSGARPVGRKVGDFGNGGSGQVWHAARIPGWGSPTHPGGELSLDGRRLFFESFDDLTLADSNGRKDVYEWEAPGSGDCTKANPTYFESNGGCLSLISSGQSSEDSFLLDATPTGAEAFITTGSSLLPQDPGLVDLYVAKENGGFPPPPSPPPPCVGDACQSVPSPPNDPTPASAGFKGAGDPKPSKGRCPKGKRRVSHRGKASCVSRKHKKQQTQKQRAKRHHGRAAR